MTLICCTGAGQRGQQRSGAERMLYGPGIKKIARSI
jgi:hypothetical protein